VIAYNKFSSDVGGLTARMEGFADEFSAILSRQIDERAEPWACRLGGGKRTMRRGGRRRRRRRISR
jgi:hypothetical protein